MKKNIWQEFDKTIVDIEIMLELQNAGMPISTKAWRPLKTYLLSMEQLCNTMFSNATYSEYDHLRHIRILNALNHIN